MSQSASDTERRLEALENENQELRKELRDFSVWAQAVSLELDNVQNQLEEDESQLAVCLTAVRKLTEGKVEEKKEEAASLGIETDGPKN